MRHIAVRFFGFVVVIGLLAICNAETIKEVETKSAKDVAKAAVQRPYILTPAAKFSINGSKIFGVRPGNPVFYKIAATGKRPMKFSVSGLPEGLKCDSKTGVITGVLDKTGEYKMTFVAENSQGKVTRVFTLVVGDRICLTPQMGWNSWNCWGTSVNDAKIRAAAKAMAESGLIEHGWTYINIDDCWQGKRDPDTGQIMPNEKFPDMKALADYVHSLGLKIGIYTDCGPQTCGKYEGSEGHEIQDIMTYAEWGFDYVKIDWCFCEGKNASESYAKFGNAIANARRDIIFSVCEWGDNEPWLWAKEAGGNSWRTTNDIVDTWEKVRNIGFTMGPLQKYAGPGHWNDPDMMVVGKLGWGPKLHDTRLTADELYSHVSLWCLLPAPLLIGCDMTQLDDFTLNLLTNDEVLSVNQDSLGLPAKQVLNGKKQVWQQSENPWLGGLNRRTVLEDDRQLWVKDLEDGSKAVGLFNNAKDAKKLGFTLNEVGFKGKCIVRDLWRQKDIGVFDKDFSVEVASHGASLLRVTSVEK